MKEKTIIIFIIVGIISIFLTCLVINEPKVCQVYPANECPDCICQECTPCNKTDPFIEIGKTINDGKKAEMKIQKLIGGK